MENNNAKNMKKFRKPLVIVAMVLMVALVCGMGAMTYSKYISSAEQNDVTATAAQWGIVITANADDLFATDYSDDNADTYATKVANGVAVNAAASGDIVAPGTTGSMTISVDGVTEVRARLVIDLNFESHIYYESYYPIEWALTKTAPTESDWKPYQNISDVGIDIEAGTTVNEDYIFSWRWKFESSHDKEDTIIGAYAAGKTDLESINDVLGPSRALATFDNTKIGSTLMFDLTVTVEQIQTETTP